MSLFHIFFSQYQNTPTYQVVLELLAGTFGIISVISAKEEKFWVFPLGIVSTCIYAYILMIHHIWGNMFTNIYYTIVSLYGWYAWLKKDQKNHLITHIHYVTDHESFISIVIFLLVMTLMSLIYLFEKTGHYLLWASIDIFCTASWLTAMYLMVKKAIENWILWIIANFIALPLYIHNHLYVTTFQYLIFIIISSFAYPKWKKLIEQH